LSKRNEGKTSLSGWKDINGLCHRRIIKYRANILKTRTERVQMIKKKTRTLQVRKAYLALLRKQHSQTLSLSGKLKSVLIA
jgi:hypothetical protein